MPKSTTSAKQNMVQIYEEALKLMNDKRYEKASQLYSKIVKSGEGDQKLAARAKSQLITCEVLIRDQATADGDTASFYDLGVFEHNSGDYDQAMKLFASALKKSDDKGHIYMAMAATEACRGNAEKAIKNLKESISIDPANRILAQNDPDLDSLSGHKEFEELVQSD